MTASRVHTIRTIDGGSHKQTHTVGVGPTIADRGNPEVGFNMATTVSKKPGAVHEYATRL